MPTYEGYHWKVYGENFDEAEIHIKEAVKFLKNKGIKKIYLIGHSMGSRMSAYYSSRNNDIEGVVIIGCRNNGDYPLNCSSTIKDTKIKVLDIYGTSNSKDAQSAKERNNYIDTKYKQIAINGAGHKFAGYEQGLINVIVNWLKE